jgi:hypothetical protein
MLAAFRQQLTPHAKTAEPQRSFGRLPSARDGKDRRRDHKTRAEFDRAFRQARSAAEEKA